ncbi:WXG100 family type VII secretion target [Streptomyces sp. NBC_00094]|uniref:WXG100 family type VII secretion target n=1 Tax=Streptomyces sp. NBC_00094 TaxID=2903620 RepID=UPI00224D1D9B|nr:WXG100 family type VII secretion target [Streptomyces sp. NBC_00094]MCX5394125.1 WXG100 family type VII secretion target [Streptomyces sp. NBC_00094]
MPIDPDLDVSEEDLKRLADDLEAMRSHLDGQVRRMDSLVDRAEARWRSEAATAYRKLHREAGADAVRIREILGVLEQAVRMSRDGFTRQELDSLSRMRAESRKVDVDAEVRELSGEGSGGGSDAPRSRISDI